MPTARWSEPVREQRRDREIGAGAGIDASRLQLRRPRPTDPAAGCRIVADALQPCVKPGRGARTALRRLARHACAQCGCRGRRPETRGRPRASPTPSSGCATSARERGHPDARRCLRNRRRIAGRCGRGRRRRAIAARSVTSAGCEHVVLLGAPEAGGRRPHDGAEGKPRVVDVEVVKHRARAPVRRSTPAARRPRRAARTAE